jgi:hypothetical protein
LLRRLPQARPGFIWLSGTRSFVGMGKISIFDELALDFKFYSRKFSIRKGITTHGATHHSDSGTRENSR